MTTEQSAPQSEQKEEKFEFAFTITSLSSELSHVKSQLQFIDANQNPQYYRDFQREYYSNQIEEFKTVIRILEAWPMIKRTLEEYGQKENWSDEDNYDIRKYFDIWNSAGHGYEPAQRALALLKGDGK